MKNLYAEKILINDTNGDFSAKVPIYEIMRLLEIVAFNNADNTGLDHETMLKESNAFWIVSKIKLNILDDFTTGENIRISTWTNPPSMVRVDRNFTVKSGRKIKAKAISEWCCLDADTRRPRKMSSIKYPEFELHPEKSGTTPFTNMRLDVDKSNYCYTRTIRSSDIDLNNHTNNLKYNIMAIDSFSTDELRDMKIKEYEIYFVNESHEGDEIEIYKKRQGNYYYIEGKIEDKTIFRAVFKFVKSKK